MVKYKDSFKPGIIYIPTEIDDIVVYLNLITMVFNIDKLIGSNTVNF